MFSDIFISESLPLKHFGTPPEKGQEQKEKMTFTMKFRLFQTVFPVFLDVMFLSPPLVCILI